jgi:hypothetical protein
MRDWDDGYDQGYNKLLEDIKAKAKYVEAGGWDFEDFFDYIERLTER